MYSVLVFLISGIICCDCFVHIFEPSSNLNLNTIRSITVMASVAVPFVIYDKESSTLKGLDVDIIKNFAEKLNLRVNFVLAEENINEVFKDGMKITDQDKQRQRNFLRSISKFEIDILIGALDENLQTKQYFTASRYYHYISLTWFVQKSKPIAMWKNLLYLTRDPFVCISLACVGFIAAFFSFFGQQFEPHKSMDINHILINGVGNIWGVAAPYKATILSHRIGFAFFLFGAVLNSTIASSFVILIITSPILSPHVTSIAEIIDGDFSLVGDQFAFDKISEQNKVYPMVALDKFTVTNETDEYSEQLDWNYKLAVVSSIERAQYFQLNRHFDLYSFTHPNQIYTYALKFLMRPSFSFANELNRFIEQATEGGLIYKWLKNYRTIFKRKVQNEVIYNNFENMVLIFSIPALLWLFAFSVLLVERIVFRKVRTVESRRFWRFIEILIDPDRHFLMEKYNLSLSEHSPQQDVSLKYLRDFKFVERRSSLIFLRPVAPYNRSHSHSI